MPVTIYQKFPSLTLASSDISATQVVIEKQKSTSVLFFIDFLNITYYYVELTNINNSMNKYERAYQIIISNGSTTKQPGYERHHIVPESLGGTDDASNLVYISARVHFVCHWLLTKIYPTGEEHWKMLNALRMMRAENPNQKRYKTKITSRVYAKLKEEYSVLQSQRMKGSGNGFYGKRHTDDAKQRISEANTGRIQPLHEKEKQRAKMTGRTREAFSEEWLENLSKNHRSKQPGFDGSLSEETKKKIGDRIRGTKQSEETKQKKADAIRGLKREKRLCPHCQQLVAVNGYARWHGDNCKYKGK
jgi:hypothetical protein